MFDLALTHSLLSGGAWSSFASMCFKYATMRPQPSLGASGSVIVLAATVAFANPDAQFSLIFLPMFHFKAINMVRFDYISNYVDWILHILCIYIFNLLPR